MDPQNNESETFESKVNNLVSTVTRDDAGKLQFPEGTDEALTYAARTEIRRRDTQSALSTSQAKNRVLAAENEGFISKWEEDAVKTLSKTEQTELDELKNTDPDAWHARLNTLQEEKRSNFASRKQEVSDAAVKVADDATREETFAAFEEQYPGVLTTEALNNDIPVRLVRQLEKGEVNYKDFLQNCADFLTKGKVLPKGDDAGNDVNLSEQPGNETPGEHQAELSDAEQYKSQEW